MKLIKSIKNGVAFKKISKKEFALSSDYEEITVRFNGNLFKGIVVSVGKNNYQLLDPAPWYMYIFGFIPILMNIILGNNPILPQYGFYYIGGAIGGAIGGIFTVLSLVLSSLVKKPILKILIALGCIVASFAISFGLGNAIASLIY